MTQNDRLKLVRETLNYTQTEFGKKIDVGQTYLSQIEKGDRPLTEKIIKLVCYEFHVSYMWLVNGDGEMFTNSDAALKDKIDIIMESENDFHKQLVKSIVDLDDDELLVLEELVNKIANKKTD